MNDALTISVRILKKKCQQIFSPASAVIMSSGENLLWPDSGVTEVIFFGNAPNLITQKFLWVPGKRVRLWTLSVSHKKLLTGLLNIPEKNVGVLPRSLLYPQKKKERPFPFNGPFTLVYSGRLTSEKNFLLCAEVAATIQKMHAFEVRFVICGPWSEKEKKSLPGILRKFKWKRPPEIKGDLGSFWYKKISGNPVLLNLSTYLQEDFGVSVAQAQSEGWPLILSEWGGHLDVQGRNCVKIPAHYIFKSKANAIAGKCLKTTPETKPYERNRPLKPKAITYEEIENILDSSSANHIQTLQKAFSDIPLRRGFTKNLERKIKTILSGGF